MLSYKDKAGSNVDVDLAFPNNMLYNIRLPILIYFGYRLYNKLFFNQFLQILLFGSLANIVLVPIAAVIFHYFLRLVSSEDMSYLQSMMLVSVSLFTDPMTIIQMKPNKNFFLFLGIFILGNSTLLDIFCSVAKLASVDFKSFSLGCGILVVATFLDIVLGAMLGCLVGILTSLMSILTRREPDIICYESTIAVGGTLVSYFLASYLTLQPFLSVLSCCLVQERYVFNNMDIDNVRTVKDGLKALTHLVQGLFFLYVGYYLANVEAAAVWEAVLVVLSVTYVVKALIMTIFLALLNIKKKASIKEMFSVLPMLVFGGSRGPRSWAVVMHCQRFYHMPYFSDYVLFTIALSVLVDTFIFKTISEFMEEDDEDLGEELETNDCFKWLASVEKNLFHVLVKDVEMTRDDDYDSGVKNETKRQKKLEQHALPQKE